MFFLILFLPDNHLLYFDPHTTQPSVPMIGGWIEDETYHLQRAERMPISELDPSLALVIGLVIFHNNCYCSCL